MHHEQPVVTLRLLLQAGSVCDPPREERRRGARGGAARSGHDDELGRADRRHDRLDRRRARHGRGQRPELRQRRRDEGQPGARLRSAVRRRAQSGVRAGGDRSPAPAGGLRAEGQPRGSRTTSRASCSIGSSTASIPYGLPGTGTPESLQRSPPTDLRAFHDALLRAEQRHSRRRRRRDGRGGVRRRRARVRQLGDARRAAGAGRRTARADAAARHRQQAGRRADRDPRRPPRDRTRSTRTTSPWIWPSRFSAAKAATGCTGCCGPSAASPTAPRPTCSRSSRRGDFMAETDTRTETTGEVLRLIVDEFRKLQRERVNERELADAQAYLAGQLPADDRDARCDRRAGAQRAVLRPAARARSRTTASGSTPSRRTTSSAWRGSTSGPIGCRSCSWATRRASSSS